MIPSKARAREVDELEEYVLREAVKVLSGEQTDPERDRLLAASRLERIAHMMRDPRGAPLVPAEIHEAMHQHREACDARGMHALQMWPFGHGKTEQLVVGDILDEIGQHPDGRYGIISAADDVAMDRAMAVRAYIEADDGEFVRMYPEVRPGEDDWQKTRFTVTRKSVSSNPTLRATGVLSSRTGIRFDRVWFDDVDDDKSMAGAMRASRARSFWNVWMPRLDAGCLARFIATAWHEDDIAHDLIDTEGWGCAVAGVSEDLDAIELVRFYNEPGTPRAGKRWQSIRELAHAKGADVIELPLWEARFPGGELAKRKRQRPRVFARGYQQRGYSDGEKTFPHFHECVRIDPRPSAAILRELGDVVAGTGSDIAGKKRKGSWVIGGAAGTDGVIRVHEDWIRCGAWTMPQFLDAIRDVHLELDAAFHCVETDGLQTSYQDAASVDPIRWDFAHLIIPHRTGETVRNEETGKPYVAKLDPDTGVRALDVRFMNGGFEFIFSQEHDPDCECPACELVAQFEGAPAHEHQDAIMGVWKLERGCARIGVGPKRMGPPDEKELEVAVKAKRERRASAMERARERAKARGLRVPGRER